jgi:hypothetical protein
LHAETQQEAAERLGAAILSLREVASDAERGQPSMDFTAGAVWGLLYILGVVAAYGVDWLT